MLNQIYKELIKWMAKAGINKLPRTKKYYIDKYFLW